MMWIMIREARGRVLRRLPPHPCDPSLQPDGRMPGRICQGRRGRRRRRSPTATSKSSRSAGDDTDAATTGLHRAVGDPLQQSQIEQLHLVSI